jgi:hypothetical protein
MLRGTACVAVALFLAGCGPAKNDAIGGSGGGGGSATGGRGAAASGGASGAAGATGGSGSGGSGGGSGGIGGSAGGGVGGAAAGTSGAAGAACLAPAALCPAVYTPRSADSTVGCTPQSGSPCWDDTPCGAGRSVSGEPDFENTLTCIYDGTGQLVSATTCGYEAYYRYCPSLFGCGTSSRQSCTGSPGECFHVGADVTCAVDAGSD